jgi:transposase
MSDSSRGTDRLGRRAKRFLTPLQKYEIWLQLIRQETTIGEAADQWEVDRSTIMRLREVAKQGALAALAESRPGTRSREQDLELAQAKAEAAYRKVRHKPPRSPPSPAGHGGSSCRARALAATWGSCSLAWRGKRPQRPAPPAPLRPARRAGLGVGGACGPVAWRPSFPARVFVRNLLPSPGSARPQSAPTSASQTRPEAEGFLWLLVAP